MQGRAVTKKQYSQEFKLDAVSLVLEQGHSRAAASRNLEVDPNLLRRWVKEYQKHDEGQASFQYNVSVISKTRR